MAKTENLVLSALESSNEGLTLTVLAEKVGESEKKVFKALRKLFEKGLIDSAAHRYRLSNR